MSLTDLSLLRQATITLTVDELEKLMQEYLIQELKTCTVSMGIVSNKLQVYISSTKGMSCSPSLLEGLVSDCFQEAMRRNKNSVATKQLGEILDILASKPVKSTKKVIKE